AGDREETADHRPERAGAGDQDALARHARHDTWASRRRQAAATMVRCAATMIDRARLQALFLELVRIDSLSRREGRIAARLARELGELGAKVGFDDAGVAVGGETGNLIAHVTGTADAPALLLCAHMDTVSPGEGVRPLVEDDVIRSDGK